MRLIRGLFELAFDIVQLAVLVYFVCTFLIPETVEKVEALSLLHKTSEVVLLTCWQCVTFTAEWILSLLCLVFDVLVGEISTSRWVKTDIEGLENDLRNKLFGQPFVLGALAPLVRRHLQEQAPSKPLVLSFHGGPGVGKTYVTQLIARNMYRRGERSIYFKYFSLASDSSLDELKIMQKIDDTILLCERAVFVFDEAEHMSKKMFEELSTLWNSSGSDKFPFLWRSSKIRKSIIIFISNIGTDRINQLALTRLKEGKSRYQYEMEDFKKVLGEAISEENNTFSTLEFGADVFYLSLIFSILMLVIHSIWNKQHPTFQYSIAGAFRDSMLVKNGLIDMYVPFLPLEKSHVQQCIEAEAQMYGSRISAESIRRILEDLEFFPASEGIYSSSGCKSISSLVVRQPWWSSTADDDHLPNLVSEL